VHYIGAYLVKAMASTDSAVQEPMTYNEAKQGQESMQWVQAVKEEMDALFKAGTYQPVDLPQGHKALGVLYSSMGSGNALVNGSANIIAIGQKVRYTNPFATLSATCSCLMLICFSFG